jgi:hypothetical protein
MVRRIIAILLFLCFGGLVWADQPVLTREAVEVPAGVPDAVKGALQPEALTVKLGDSTVARFWFTAALSAAKTPSTELGVQYTGVAVGSLVGVVQIEGIWKDYKENAIQAGVYTLRYGVMPADGNHMGVAIYRDFLILLAPAEDPGPGQMLSYDDMVAASVTAAGVPHPAILSLFPIWDELSEPAILKNEIDQWMLGVKLGDQNFGMVVEGHGEG